MKNFTLLSLFFFICIAGFSQENKLVGKWINSSENNKGEQFEFKDDKTAYMIKEGITSPAFKYKFNATKTPNWIDLEVDASDFQMKMQGLVEFIDDNTLKLELFPENNSEHPSQFTPVETSNDVAYVILKRI